MYCEEILVMKYQAKTSNQGTKMTGKMSKDKLSLVTILTAGCFSHRPHHLSMTPGD